MTSHRSGVERDDAPPTDDRFAADLRGFGPIGILAILAVLFGNSLFLPLGALLVLGWASRSHTPWRAIGYVRPHSWLVTVVGGLVIGVALKLMLKSIVLPLLGADPINHAYHYLAGNRAAVPGFLYTIIVGAGFGEETIFRGFLFERLGRLLGTSAQAKTATVVITAVLFGLAHYSNQGVTGVQQGTITGLVFGTIFVLTGEIWLPMIAHAAFDLTAYAIIYWGLETRVAHFFFC